MLVFTCQYAIAQQSANTIIIYDGKASIFPDSWLEKPVLTKATKPDSDITDTTLVLLKIAMNKYSSKAIGNLKKVYVVGKLFFYGENFTGTNTGKDIYIATKKNDNIEKTFHHEASSVLLRLNPFIFDKNKWQQISPASLQITGPQGVKQGLSSVNFNLKLLPFGFLCDYALTNWENDFNMYAENIFAGGKEFWALVDQYPLVRKKTDMIIEFYYKIDPVFSENYFRSIVD